MIIKNPFKIGDIVAYNQSGDVVLGKILDMSPTLSGWDFWNINAKIQKLDGEKISKVKRPESMCFICRPSQMSATWNSLITQQTNETLYVSDFPA